MSLVGSRWSDEGGSTKVTTKLTTKMDEGCCCTACAVSKALTHSPQGRILAGMIHTYRRTTDGLANAVLPALTSAILISICLPALAAEKQEAVRLQYKPPAGHRATYEFTGKMRQKMEMPEGPVNYSIDMTGTVHHMVAGTDAKTGLTLMGILGSGKWEIVSGEKAAEQKISRDQTWVSVYRVETSGQCKLRESKSDDARRYSVREIADQISAGSQICAPFPAGDVSVGKEWKGEALLPLLGAKQVGTAVSTLVEIRNEEGRKVCIIKSKVTSGADRALGTWKPDIRLPESEVEGTTEGWYDIEGSFWTKMKWDLWVTMRGRVGEKSFTGNMRLESENKLVAQETLPRDAAKANAARILDIDTAFDMLYTGNIDKGVQWLGQITEREKDADWRKALETTRTVVKPVLAAEAVSSEKAPGELARLLKDAEEAAAAKNWQKAVAKYAEIRDRWPGLDVALQAIEAAALIHEQELGQKETAVKLRRQAVAALEKKSNDSKAVSVDPLILYRLAAAYSSVADHEKAADAYGRYLAACGDKAPAATIALAQYRFAEALEASGNPKKALEQYRAIAGSKGDDSYLQGLRKKAGERVKALEGKDAGK